MWPSLWPYPAPFLHSLQMMMYMRGTVHHMALVFHAPRIDSENLDDGIWCWRKICNNRLGYGVICLSLLIWKCLQPQSLVNKFRMQDPGCLWRFLAPAKSSLTCTVSNLNMHEYTRAWTPVWILLECVLEMMFSIPLQASCRYQCSSPSELNWSTLICWLSNLVRRK